MGRSHGLAHVYTTIRYGKFGGYRLKENDVCGLATFKRGIAIWEGPIAYLMLVQFLETNVRPLYVSYCRCVMSPEGSISSLDQGQRVKASPMAWRSSKLKRKFFSTYGDETQAMLQGVNEVDWLQIMYRDATLHDVQLKSWRNSLSPHMLVLPRECELGGRQQQCSVTDAKSLYNCLLREHPIGKQDRKYAIVLKDLQQTKSMVRWVPHQKMIVDCLTKEDPLRANDALKQFLRSGVLSLVDVAQELSSRRNDPTFKRRRPICLRVVTDINRLIEEYQSNFAPWIQPLVNYIGSAVCHLKVPYHLTKGIQPFDPPLPWLKDERFVCVHGCKTGCAVSWANCNHSRSFRSGLYANYIC